MGVQGLLPNIQKFTPNAIKKHADWSAFRGQKLALDVAPLMYSSACARRSPEDTSFLQRFVRITDDLQINWKISVLWVFDGKAPPLKDAERRKRHEQRDRQLAKRDALLTEHQQLQQELEASGVALPNDDSAHVTPADIESIAGCGANGQFVIASIERLRELKASARSSTPVIIEPELYISLQNLFFQEKIPFVVANGEAEKCCAQLAKRNLVDVVVTQDTDALVYGAPRVIFKAFDSRYPEMWEISLEAVCTGLGWEQSQFVEFCVLCGTDFWHETLPKVGPIKARELIDKFRSLEQLSKSLLAEPTHQETEEEHPKKRRKTQPKKPCFPRETLALSSDERQRRLRGIEAACAEFKEQAFPFCPVWMVVSLVYALVRHPVTTSENTEFNW